MRQLKLLALLALAAALAFAQAPGIATSALTWASSCGSQPCGATPTFTIANAFTPIYTTLTATTITGMTFSAPVNSAGWWKICQDGTGGRTSPTWPGTFVGFAAMASTAASYCEYYSWHYDGTSVIADGKMPFWGSPAFVPLTDGATVTWAIGNTQVANTSLTFTTHGGSRTLNLTGLMNGGSYVLWIKQDGTGGEGLTLGTGCTWKVSGGGSGAITPSTGANLIDVLAFTYDGASGNCYANFNKNFN